MSDQNPPSKPPSKQTSSVPLMKETVRVTLKAADTPPTAPSASIQGQQPTDPAGPPTPAGANEPPTKNTARVSLPKKATSPQSLPVASAPPGGPPAAGSPPAPPASPTAPPKATTPLSKTPSAARPAPTIQLKTAGGGKPGASAPTIRLATSSAPVGAQSSLAKSGLQPGPSGATPSSALPGAAPIPASAPTRALGQASLPKATVQLSPPTKPLTAPGSPTGQTVPTFKIDGGYQAPPEPIFVKILSGFGLAASIVLVVFQIMQANIWMSAEDNSRREHRKWSQLIE